jgi:hypothetical protein
MAAASVAFCLLLRFCLMRENRKMDEGRALGWHGPSEVQLAANFRYQL